MVKSEMKFFPDSPKSIDFLSTTGNSKDIYFIPGFTGIGAPHWNSEIRAAIYGITRDTSQKDITTAAFKALIYQVIDIKDALSEDGIEIKNLSIDGGMASNKISTGRPWGGTPTSENRSNPILRRCHDLVGGPSLPRSPPPLESRPELVGKRYTPYCFN